MVALRHVTIVACLLFFLLSAGSSIRIPGLYYDEVLFVNAALGNTTGPFINASVMGVPVMLMSYVGALKSYIYYPIFEALGVSPATIRWPAILISVVTLALVYLVATRFVSRGHALGVLALTATDPVFIGLSKLDYGPVALGALLRVGAVLAFLEFVRTGGWRPGLTMVAAVALGLFDKLHFIWFVNALAVAALVARRDDMIRVARSSPRRFAVLAAALGVIVAGAAWFRILPIMGVRHQGQIFEPLGQHVVRVLLMSARVMNGRAATWMIADGDVIIRSWTWIAVLAAAFAAPLLIARRSSRMPVVFILLLLGVTFVQMCLTPQARGPHHTMSLWPWHHLLVVLVAGAVATGAAPPRWRSALPVVVVAILVVGQIRSTWSLVVSHRSEQGFRVAWDPAIFALSAALEGSFQTAPRIVSTDWGLHTPIHALAPPSQRSRYLDAWNVFVAIDRRPSQVRRRWGEQLAQPGGLTLLHAEDATTFPITRRNVFDLAREQGLTYARLSVIANAAGRPLYEIYRFERVGHAAAPSGASRE
jgi:hypothetical protein